MWGLHCEESWAPKKIWCFWTVVVEKTLGSPLDCKEILPLHPEDPKDQSWVFTGRTGLKLKLQYFGHLACCNPRCRKELDHGLQHARVPCPSPIPRACSNSCPSSPWCHPTISSSVVPFSCLQSFPASRSFPRSQFFASSGQSIEASASASVLLIGRWVLYHFLITILIVLYVSKNIFLFFFIPVQANIKSVDRS